MYKFISKTIDEQSHKAYSVFAFDIPNVGVNVMTTVEDIPNTQTGYTNPEVQGVTSVFIPNVKLVMNKKSKENEGDSYRISPLTIDDMAQLMKEQQEWVMKQQSKIIPDVGSLIHR